MAGSRKDKRGYVLRRGECQRKDGRYVFAYTNQHGERKSIYAKTLQELRIKERKIIRDLEDGLDPLAAEKMSLNRLYDRYIEQKYDLKLTTQANYKYIYDRFVRDSFGKRKIGKICFTDVKKFYYSLIIDRGLSGSIVDNVNTQLHPAFQMAVRDGLLRLNPTDGVMAEIKKSHYWAVPRRRALTIKQQKVFMDCLRTNRQFYGWLPMMTVLLGTGMRIGECLGLRWEDLDFEKRIISVNHNLTYHPNLEGVSEHHISTPKTAAGIRYIPMIDEVYEAFLQEYQFQQTLGGCTAVVDGYTGFVFTSLFGNVYTFTCVNHAIHRIINWYNSQEMKTAKKERREPFLLPQFSAHNLRHTFCTRVCENETNLKVIQSLMGHADITTTMDIYAECTEEKKQEIVANLNGKIIV